VGRWGMWLIRMGVGVVWFPTTEGQGFGYLVRDGFLHRSGLMVEEWGPMMAFENCGPSNLGSGDGNSGIRVETRGYPDSCGVVRFLRG